VIQEEPFWNDQLSGVPVLRSCRVQPLIAGEPRPMLTLRRLRQQELSVGISLPGPIYDAKGTLLAPAGQELTDTLLGTLPSQLYTDESWVSHRTASQVVDDVFQRLGRERPVSCERRLERRPWVVPLFIDVEHTSNIGVVRQQARVTTQDLSAGGFSFLHKQFIPVGVRILAHFNVLPDKPVVPGEVRSCILVTGMQHRVGVQFLAMQ
jgi:hypothetical protein